MPLKLTDTEQQDAINSIQQYFEENFDEDLGGLKARELLQYFVEEIGPCIYNRAVADVQERLQARVAEIDVEVHEDAFQYWRRRSSAKRRK